MKKIFTMMLLAVPLLSAAQGRSAADGAYILNEDWFGHNNSTLNFWNLKEGYVDYLLIKNANRETEGINSLGCTSQYAQIYGDRLYAMSKQDQDSGEKAYTGGRFVIVNLNDMKVEKGFASLATNASGVSLADGRACLAVSPDKIYLGSSNGIYVYDVAEGKISATPIKGTENEMITGDEDRGEGLGALYNNQIGNMLRGQQYVFAVKEDHGVLVIDPADDSVVTTIPGCFSAMVQSADGNIWVGMNVATGTDADGNRLDHYPYGTSAGEGWNGTRLMCIDQYSLDTHTVDLKAGGIPQSWYAWTAGSFAAHPRKNILYYVYSDPSAGRPSWFSAGALYRYDIDKGTQAKVCDLAEYGIHFYSSGLRVNPVDGLLYGYYYSGGISSNTWGYFTIEDDGSDELVTDNETSLISNYWYPAMVIFPDTEAPVVASPDKVLVDGAPVTIDLDALVSDADTPPASIIRTIKAVADPAVASATLERGKLVVNGLAVGTTSVTVEYDAGGKFATAVFDVDVVKASGIGDIPASDELLALANGNLCANCAGRVEVFSPSGFMLRTGAVSPDAPLALNGVTGPVIVKFTTSKSVHIYKYILQ